MLTIGSLFSGIGGFELGLEAAGLGPTLWQVEKDPFCNAVLAKHWPHAERFEDVCTAGSRDLAPVDLICGGFPCQDVSSAGPRTGLTGARSGLWREFSRIVSELRPRFVCVENVASGAGRWFDEVVRDLEERGYGVLPLPVSAMAVGAPHRRERLFLVAYAHDRGQLQPGRGEQDERGRAEDSASTDADGNVVRLESRRSESGRPAALLAGSPGKARDVANAVPTGRQRPRPHAHERRAGLTAHAGWEFEPGVVPLVHGVSGRLAGRGRRARIRALGNSIVPQCAEVAGWAIRELLGAGA